MQEIKLTSRASALEFPFSVRPAIAPKGQVELFARTEKPFPETAP